MHIYILKISDLPLMTTQVYNLKEPSLQLGKSTEKYSLIIFKILIHILYQCAVA